jgi:hypothetical protein
MRTILCMAGLIYGAGIFLLAAAARRAPEGYEDEDGFHQSSEDQK